MSYSLSLASAGRRRRIKPNPPAGEVRSREYRHGPWMQLTNQRLEAENAKAEGVIFEKRVFDLAKQAVAALQGDMFRTARTRVVLNRWLIRSAKYCRCPNDDIPI